MISESIGSYIPWQKLLVHLGQEAMGAALPANIPCPLCRGGMTVYHDPAVAGAWYWCRDCKFAGDGLELAARHRNEPYARVLSGLFAAGFEIPPERQHMDALSEDARNYRIRRREVYSAWLAAVNSSDAESGDAAAILRLAYRYNREKMPVAEATFGIIRRANLDAVLGRRTLGAQSGKCRPAACEPEDYSVFAGEGWRELVCMPFEDMPGRYHAFLLIGRDGRYPGDFCYRTMLRRPSSLRNSNVGLQHEAGINGLSAVLARPEHRDHGPAIFAFDRPDWALAVQCDHLANRGYTAPIVSGWEGAVHRTRHAWKLLAGRPVYMIVECLNPDRILAARACGAELLPSPTMTQSWKLLPAAADAGRIDRMGWRRAAAIYLEDAPDGPARELLRRLELSERDLELLTDSNPAARRRVADLAGGSRIARHVSVGKDDVVEEDGVWRYRKSGIVLTDAILRVDSVVTRDGDPSVRYRGRVIHKGVEHPFEVTNKEAGFFEKQIRWLRTFVARRGGGMIRCKNNTQTDLLEIARQFQEPAAIRVPSRVGWDHETGNINFPWFRILPGGTAEPLPVPMIEFGGGLEYQPLIMPTPGEARDAVLAMLAAGSLPYYLPRLALAASEILAPAFRAVFRPLSVVDTQRDASDPVVVALGLDRISLPHHWAEDAAAFAVCECWGVLDDAVASRLSPAGDIGAAFVGYLMDLARRRLIPHDREAGGSLGERLHDDICYYVADLVGGCYRYEKPRVFFGGDAPSPQALAYALRVAIATGRAVVDTDRSLQRHGPRSLLVTGDGRVHMPAAVIRSLTAGMMCPATPRSVERCIAAAGLEVVPHTVGREPGYLLPGDWFDRNSKA